MISAYKRICELLVSLMFVIWPIHTTVGAEQCFHFKEFKDKYRTSTAYRSAATAIQIPREYPESIRRQILDAFLIKQKYHDEPGFVASLLNKAHLDQQSCSGLEVGDRRFKIIDFTKDGLVLRMLGSADDTYGSIFVVERAFPNGLEIHVPRQLEAEHCGKTKTYSFSVVFTFDFNDPSQPGRSFGEDLEQGFVELFLQTSDTRDNCE
ncbi:MAG: hypothetical protein AB1540_17770 [Bdellovibrionota bacterium]